ncbi:hypothetical protein PSET11_00814 [Arthrobacter ulcerisalmonis]|uniref:DUF4282 domain-containing protein n=1 Tax=Arthrobacter ulcerisalmonis TaxID=2483813 RepID=A0A3P5WKT9_9MICC|nr:hypothetical protein PSET11_00814 [Arthrobacter ulcerisalmonis]
MKNLFDLSFTKFISPSIAKIVYILIMVGLGVTYLIFVITAFATGEPALGFVTLLIIGPLFVVIYLALARIGLESLIAGIRTAENTARLVELQGGTSSGHTSYPAGGPQNPYGQSAPNPYQSGPPAPPGYQPPAPPTS